MLHVAIDLGSQKSQICIRDEKGNITKEQSCPTNGLKKIFERLPKPSRVIVETGSESFTVAEQAQAAGHEVRVVPSTLAPSLGVGEHGVKTDRRDAQKISEASVLIDLPSVHIPRIESRRRKTLTRMRGTLVEVRTKLINSVRGWLRTEICRIRSGGAESFSRRVRERFTKDGHDLPSFVERLLGSIEDLSVKISEADEELELEAREDPTCQLLMSVPGIGPVTAMRYVATIDIIERFKGASAVTSYVGLTPGERQSGTRQSRTAITKAGDGKLRWALVQAAWTMRRVRPKDPMVRWCAEVEKRRGKQVAAVALARKLCGVLYAMWRDGTCYNPIRGAAPQE